MTTANKMFGVFNITTLELMEGPFKNKSTALRWCPRVIDREMQNYILRVYDCNYTLWYDWVEARSTGNYENLRSKCSNYAVDELVAVYANLCEVIQATPLTVTMSRNSAVE